MTDKPNANRCDFCDKPANYRYLVTKDGKPALACEACYPKVGGKK